MDFIEVKKTYIQAREEQKRFIMDKLIDEGFDILTMKGEKSKRPYQTGSGDINYTSNSTIKSFDLSNWKWISAQKNKKEYLISLQAFDLDAETGSRHVLMDRIGVYTCSEKEYDANSVTEEMQNTGIDLPMTEEKYKDLLSYLN